MSSICGANCSECNFKSECAGCEKTCGKPFGGRCVAAEYIKVGGIDNYNTFKEGLLSEINGLLKAEGLPTAERLYELAGPVSYTHLTLPTKA